MSTGQGTRIEIAQEDHKDGSIAVDARVRTRLFHKIRDDECIEEQQGSFTGLFFSLKMQ